MDVVARQNDDLNFLQSIISRLVQSLIEQGPVDTLFHGLADVPTSDIIVEKTLDLNIGKTSLLRHLRKDGRNPDRICSIGGAKTERFECFIVLDTDITFLIMNHIKVKHNREQLTSLRELVSRGAG